MKIFIHLFIVLFLSIYVTSCNALKEAGENAEKSAQNSGRAALTGESIHYGAQSKESDDSFVKYKNQMNAEEDLSEKTRYAASMIKSLTYQTIYKLDTMKYMTDEEFENYYDQKLLEDVNKMWRVIHANRPASGKFKISKTKGTDGNIKAIAVALHETSPLCELVVSQRINRTCNFVDIIKDAYRAKYVEGKDVSELKDYQKVITRNEKEFIYILDLRVKFLPVVAINQISDIDKGFMKKLSMFLFKWKPNFSSDDKYSNEASHSMTKLDELYEMKESYEDEYRAALESGEEKKAAKAKNQITKIEEMIVKQDTKNQNKLNNALEKQQESEQEGYEKPMIHDGDLDFYKKVMEKAVLDRDFLRSIYRVSGVGHYQRAIPLRFAEQDPSVLKILKNLDVSELEVMSHEELESKGYSSEERDSFLKSLKNILDNNKYKFVN